MTINELLQEVTTETPANLRFVTLKGLETDKSIVCLGDVVQSILITPTHTVMAGQAKSKEDLLSLVYAAVGPYVADMHTPLKVVCVLCVDPKSGRAWAGAGLDHTMTEEALAS